MNGGAGATTFIIVLVKWGNQKPQQSEAVRWCVVGETQTKLVAERQRMGGTGREGCLLAICGYVCAHEVGERWVELLCE